MISYFQAFIIGLMQGVTELFPISSLGHSVLLAKLFGWDSILQAETEKTSFFLTFLVAVHFATAIALFIFYRKEWYKIIAGFVSSIKNRRLKTSHEKLAWLLILATIPAGVLGLLLEKKLRTQFSVPTFAALFLIINGFILIAGDRARKRQTKFRRNSDMNDSASDMAARITPAKAGIIGVAQSFALFAGISRSGITMASGLYSKLEYESAARFSFLLATPIIFLAAVYKLPELAHPEARSILGPTLLGAATAGIAAYLSVRFLDKYFQSKRLLPFAIYCFIFGSGMIVWLAFF